MTLLKKFWPHYFNRTAIGYKPKDGYLSFLGQQKPNKTERIEFFYNNHKVFAKRSFKTKREISCFKIVRFFARDLFLTGERGRLPWIFRRDFLKGAEGFKEPKPKRVSHVLRRNPKPKPYYLDKKTTLKPILESRPNTATFSRKPKPKRFYLDRKKTFKTATTKSTIDTFLTFRRKRPKPFYLDIKTTMKQTTLQHSRKPKPKPSHLDKKATLTKPTQTFFTKPKPKTHYLDFLSTSFNTKLSVQHQNAAKNSNQNQVRKWFQSFCFAKYWKLIQLGLWQNLTSFSEALPETTSSPKQLRKLSIRIIFRTTNVNFSDMKERTVLFSSCTVFLLICLSLLVFGLRQRKKRSYTLPKEEPVELKAVFLSPMDFFIEESKKKKLIFCTSLIVSF